MVATPTLAGAVLRLVNGLLVDRIGPKRSGAISQVIVIVGLLAAYLMGVSSFGGTLALGVILGFAGASFAIALPLASRWYPPEHQGKAMGIAGMGNSGTVLASLFAPMLAKLFGWNAVLGLACIPLTLVLFAYLIMAKDASIQSVRRPMTFSTPLRQIFDPTATISPSPSPTATLLQGSPAMKPSISPARIASTIREGGNTRRARSRSGFTPADPSQ
jgi:NNP family nitrate/nitrite transporter-like MFS transporter